VKDGVNTTIFGVDEKHPLPRINQLFPPGGGTTDYAVDIFHKALSDKKNTSVFHQKLNADDVYGRCNCSDYKIASSKRRNQNPFFIQPCSNELTPTEIAAEIKKHIPEFTITYKPDFRQKIADSWPASIDDHQAREDWVGIKEI
jgi:hypothetical protein